MTPDYKKVNEELLDVYKDTLLKASLYPHSETIKYDYQRFVFDKEKSMIEINGDKNRDGNVTVIGIDTIGALQRFKGELNCLLNMASAKRPGGGVSWGSKAQEEGLFRCSNLSFSISPEEYPLSHSEGLYTYNAVFLKDFHYNDINPVRSDVITIAAINLNKEQLPIAGYENITENKIRMMIKLAARRSVDNLILGAWGSGVYKNDPTFIAGLFKKILIGEEYAKCFNNVVFAVINDENSVANNYQIYKNILV